MKKILVIVRASTLKQETESQRKEMEEFCLGLGYRSEEIEYLISAGASARTPNKKYLDMLEQIKETIITENIKAVGLWHINRLGRLESYLMMMKEWFISNRIQVYIKNPSLVLLNEDGSVNSGTEIAFSVFATLVKHETEEMMAKMKRGKQRNREAGLIADGGVPFGCKVVEKRIVEDETRSFVIKEVFKMYISGESTAKILKYMAEYGFACTSTHLYRVLRNKRYIGTCIDESTFLKAQKQLEAKNTGYPQERAWHLGSQLLVCGTCGRHYVCHKGTYECIGRRRNVQGNSRCTQKESLTQYRVDSILVYCTSIVYSWWINVNAEENQKILETKLRETLQRLESTNKRLEEFQRRIDDATENKILGLLSVDRWSKLVEKLKTENSKDIKEKHNLEIQVKELKHDLRSLTEKKSIEKFIKLIDSVEELKRNENRLELYRLVHSMINNVYVLVRGKFKILVVSSKVGEFKFRWLMHGSGTNYRLLKLECEDQELETENSVKEILDSCRFINLTHVEELKRKY